MKNIDDILSHKARLAERSTSQRTRLALQVQSLQPLFSMGDRGVSAVQSVRSHPVLAAASLGIILALRSGRSLKWLRRSLVAWRAWRWARDRLVPFMQSK